MSYLFALIVCSWAIYSSILHPPLQGSGHWSEPLAVRRVAGVIYVAVFLICIVLIGLLAASEWIQLSGRRRAIYIGAQKALFIVLGVCGASYIVLSVRAL